MPSCYRSPNSPPLPPLSFNKPTTFPFLHPAPPVYSSNSSQSQYSANMIPPRYATNLHPTSQFSNTNANFQPQTSHPPTPAEQNFTLSQTWLWVPHTKCSLFNDPIPHAVYLITLVSWNGYEKLFDLEPLTPSSSSNRNSRPEIYHNILEHQLRAPLEATLQNTTSLPLHPREPPRRVSTGLSIGMHGRALGIAISNVQAPFQHHVHGEGMSTGSEVLYSQYNGGTNSPQQYFSDDQRRRSANDSDSEGYSTASTSSDEKFRQSDRGSRSSDLRGVQDSREKDKGDSDSRHGRGSREEGRGSSDHGRTSASDREEKRTGGKKEGGRMESSKQGASKKKEKSGSSKGKKPSSRSSSLSSTMAIQRSKKK